MTDAELDQCRRDGGLLRSIIEGKDKVALKRNAPTRWVGCCPFHDEKTASFTVYADGHFHCFGCSAHGTVFDYVMRRDGIEFRDAVRIIEEQLGFATGANLKRKPNNGADPHKDDHEFHAVIPPPKDAPAPLDQLNGRYQPFEYVTSRGETHHYQRRIDQGDGKKMFLPLTYGVLNGATGWHAKAPPQPWPLYRLDLLTSADPDSWVVIVEGEGKCEAAERMFPGYVCTAWMNGAGSVDCSDWEILKRFREERLIWWGDADRPSADGRPHGCFIAEPAFRKLFPGASYIDTSGLSDRKDGYDAKDLEADLGDEDPEAWLEARLKTAPPPGGTTSGGGFTDDGSPPGGDARSEGDPGTRPGNGSTGQNAAPQLLDYIIASSRAELLPPERPWLVEHWIPRRQVALIGGMGGIGKTLLALQLMIGCAKTGKWLGLNVMRCKAWGLFAEDEDDEIDLRLRDNAELADLGDLAWRSEVVDPCELVEADPHTGKMQATDYFQRLCDTVKHFGARLVVLDAAANLFGGDELRRRHVAFFIRVLRKLAIDIDGAVVLLAHPSNQGIANSTGISGSTAWWNSVRSLLVFELPKKADGEDDPDENDRILRREKANYARRREVIRFHWVDGGFVADEPPSGIDAIAQHQKAERVFKMLLAEALRLGDKLSPIPSAPKTYAPRVFAERPNREGVSENDFIGAMLRLRQKGDVIVKEEGPPSRRRAYLALQDTE